MFVFLAVFLLSHLYHGLGITIGYHRLLAHKALRLPKWLEYLIISGGYLAFEGSPIYWVTAHRVHHRVTDKPGDPHSPVDGFWHSYAGWLYASKVEIPDTESRLVSPDLYRDPVYRFLDCGHTNWHALLCLVLCVLFRAAIFAAFGPMVCLASILGAFTAFNAPFLVNSICHMKNHGYRNFETDDLSRNVWWVGLIAVGEGWHNNHHALPQSARHGLKPTEIDISWLLISFLKTVGLATDIRLPKQTRWSVVPALASRYETSSGGAVKEPAGIKIS